MVTNAELIFWTVSAVVALAFFLWVMAKPRELYYEGRTDKIGGKGGR